MNKEFNYAENHWVSHFRNKGGPFSLFAKCVEYAFSSNTLLIPFENFKKEKDFEKSLGELVKKNYLMIIKEEKTYIKIIHSSLVPYLELQKNKVAPKENLELKKWVEDKNYLEEMIAIEEKRLQSLVKKARELDDLRLNEPENSPTTLEAINAGIKARKQKAYLEGLEYLLVVHHKEKPSQNNKRSEIPSQQL